MNLEILEGDVFTTFPKNISIWWDDARAYPDGYDVGLSFDTEGGNRLVIFMSEPQFEQLRDAIGPTHSSGGEGNRLENLIDERGCHKVQARNRQLKDIEKGTSSNSRSYNFKKWFAGERDLPGLCTMYYNDYLPGHERGHTLTDDCQIDPPIP